MNMATSPRFLAILKDASRFALQWRLLLIWLVVLLMPTALAVLPVWTMLADLFNHSVYVSELAQHLDANTVHDVIVSVVKNQLALHGGGLMGFVVALLFSPFLTGVALTAAKSNEVLKLGQLVHGGIAEYWRLLRMLLVAAIPLGVAIGIGSAAMDWANTYAGKAVLESSADLANKSALVLTIVLFIIADATLDAGRAQFALSGKRRSAIKAWWRGLKLIVARPFASLGSYLLLTLFGFALAALFGVLRINMPQVGVFGFVAAFAVTQAIVAAMAWLRGARLFALVQLAKAEQA
jgi:hypothetical protein